jgi:purine-nucleoside phosphorylase
MIDSEHYRRQVDEAIAFLKEKTSVSPRLGIILGTGMSEMLPDMAVDSVTAYADIPSFPKPTVEGHTGNLVCGVVGQTNVAVLQGRFHYYEGYTTRELTLPVRVLAGLGTEVIIIVNAAGGLNTGYTSGTVMILNDHLNFIGDNPLRGPNVDAWGPRFLDLSNVYDAELIDLTIRCGRELQIGNLTTGVYIAIPGPSLETPAETRYLRSCGGDAVGMSTVPEAIVARHAGMKILGLSLIANVNDPEDFQPVVLEEVIGRVKEEMPRLMRLLTGVIRKMEAIGL